MRKLLYTTLTSLTILLMCVSCSSVDADAKRAAELNMESLKYLDSGEFEESDKLLDQSQKLIDKYRNTQDFGEFMSVYNKTLDSQLAID